MSSRRQFLSVPAALAASAAAASQPVREDIEWLDVWLPNTNRHDLPRVLLIGDSITRSYGKQVEAGLAGRAYVGRMATSKSLGDPALLDQVALVLKEQSFDVVHFNNGLHGGGYTEAAYQAAFPKLIALLRRHASKAKLLWASSTDVRVKNQLDQVSPRTARVVERNRIAAAIVGAKHIPINDLFPVAAGHPEYHASDGVHFTENGAQILATHVVHAVGRLLRP